MMRSVGGRESNAATTLGVAVAAPASEDAISVVESWQGLAGVRERPDDFRVGVVAWPPDLPTSAGAHLVVGVGHAASVEGEHEAVDVWTDIATAHELWRERVLPFHDNLAANRRAPRRRVAELTPPDATWPAQARRLIARLERVLGDAALRIDHIGSTSVRALAAKDLIDIQVVVADLQTADATAEHARDAGFVRVPGRWTGPDRYGTQFDEVVLVDADPGRPVNVNLRSVGDPVWRETLLFRDWLVADAAKRDRYLAFKRRLAETTENVDEYSSGKLPWIRDALEAASRWAQEVGWQPA